MKSRASGRKTAKEGKPLRVWALLGARAGDNSQVLALAEALGMPFEIKQLEYNRLHVLGPRLLGRSLASLTSASRAMVDRQPPPDLTISVGHRSVPVVQALRHRSRGATRSVHIGFPRVSPSKFDLVVTTPQYPVPEGDNVLGLPFALAGSALAPSDPADESILACMAAPRRLLLVGGPNLYWRIDESHLMETLGAMIEQAQQSGGSVLVSTSPRTPPSVKANIARALNHATVPTLLAEPRHPPSYASMISAAGQIHVTADSVAMVSDAIWTGKPMALVRVAPNALGAAAMTMMGHLRPGRRIYPQDLRFFWRAIADLGVGEHLSRPHAAGAKYLEQIVNRIRCSILG